MPKCVIRPLKSRDLPNLLKLAQAYWGFEKIRGFRAKDYRKLAVKILKNPSLGRIWVAVEGDRLLGYLVVVFLMSLEYGGIAAEIDELYVDRMERGRGVGDSLLKAAGKRLTKEGVVQICLRVGKSNAVGIRFYKKMGFRRRNEFLVMDRKRRVGMRVPQ
jgi:ribosomal protein S18 acetylase RimI-like enzyme